MAHLAAGGRTWRMASRIHRRHDRWRNHLPPPGACKEVHTNLMTSLPGGVTFRQSVELGQGRRPLAEW